MIYHITAAGDWEAAREAGSYRAASLASEGFIHLSARAQVLWVADRFYRGQAGLVLLAVDPARLTAELRYEESEPGQRFPHLYGPLDLGAVVAVAPFSPGPGGGFRWPEGLP